MEELFLMFGRDNGIERSVAKRDYAGYKERFMSQLPYLDPPNYMAEGVTAACRNDPRPVYLREGTAMAAMSM